MIPEKVLITAAILVCHSSVFSTLFFPHQGPKYPPPRLINFHINEVRLWIFLFFDKSFQRNDACLHEASQSS